MFKLFRRRKDKPSVMYGVFQKMGNAWESRQRRITDYLNRRTVNLSKRQLTVGLVLFCLLFGGGAVLIVVQAFQQPADTAQIKPIRVPQHAIIPEQRDRNETLLSHSEIERILTLQNYLDSLRSTASGRVVYDSIAKHRPGLLDSLAFINQYYSNQLKKSEYEYEAK